MHFLSSIAVSAILVGNALAAPSQPSVTSISAVPTATALVNSNSSTNETMGRSRYGTASKVDGEFTDGYGKLTTDQWSLVFADGTQEYNLYYITLTDGNTGDDLIYQLPCDGLNGDWYPINWDKLPYGVEVHGGNFCKNVDNGPYDNVWIKYADQFLNVPTDHRCGDVGHDNWHARCIIDIHPK